MSKPTYVTRLLTEEEAQTVSIEKTLEDGKSANRSWTRAQLEMLGVAWPPVTGWKAALIRQKLRLSREHYGHFVALRKVT